MRGSEGSPSSIYASFLLLWRAMEAGKGRKGGGGAGASAELRTAKRDQLAPSERAVLSESRSVQVQMVIRDVWHRPAGRESRRGESRWSPIDTENKQTHHHSRHRYRQPIWTETPPEETRKDQTDASNGRGGFQRG